MLSVAETQERFGYQPPVRPSVLFGSDPPRERKVIAVNIEVFITREGVVRYSRHCESRQNVGGTHPEYWWKIISTILQYAFFTLPLL